MGRKGVRIELWPVAADHPRGKYEGSLWLLSGMDAWRGPVLDAADSVHAGVETMAARLEPFAPVLIHSTSWRPAGPVVILTYVAVFDPGRDLALDMVEGAKPITLEQIQAWGTPYAHEATEPPIPRRADVLEHGLGHLRWLRGDLANTPTHLGTAGPCMDSAVRAALSGTAIDRWLDLFTPTLAGLYVTDDEYAVA